MRNCYPLSKSNHSTTYFVTLKDIVQLGKRNLIFRFEIWKKSFLVLKFEKKIKKEEKMIFKGLVPLRPSETRGQWATSLTWENNSNIIMLIKRKKTHYLLYENSMVLHLNKLESPSPNARMLCAKFDWNWPSGSGEEDF